MAMTLPPPVTSTQPVVVSVPVEPTTTTTDTQNETEEQVSPPLKPQTPPVAGVQPLKKVQEAMEQGADSALRVVCKQEDLARGISLVNVAVLEHSTLPILQNLLITTDQGRLRISSTNLEIGVQVWIDAEIQVEGTVVVPADRLRKLIGTLPKERVTISVPAGSQTLTVACPGSKTTIRSVGDPREFPHLPSSIDDELSRYVVNTGTLKAMITQVEFAADTDIISKPVRASIKLAIHAGELTLVAADTFRLCERIHPLPDDTKVEGDLNILVPAKNLAKLATILPAQGLVTFHVTPNRNQVVFHFEQGEQVDFSSRLMVETYMDYKRAIAKEFQTRVVADTKQLMRAVERSALYAVDTRKSVRCTIAAEQNNGTLGTLTLDADDASLGDSVTVLEAEVSGPRQAIFFHVKYLYDALAHIDSPQVSIEINATGKPVVIKPVAAISYLQLLQTQGTAKTSV